MQSETKAKVKGARELAKLSPEYKRIVDLVDPGSSVLDLGCGEGDLLKALQVTKRVRAQGIELSEEAIRECVGKGLFAYHGDLDEGLADFNDQSVDYVIITNTLQVLHRPDFLLNEAARVGKKCIVSVLNFAYWRVRYQLFFKGIMPKTGRLPYEWYDSPNIHHTTVKDFRDFCRKRDLEILEEIFIKTSDDGKGSRRVNIHPNFFADYGIFVFRRK